MDETLKPCPFCGGEADYHSEKGPTGEVYGWVGCNQCDAMSCHTDTRSMQPEETHPIDAWNTRADAAPTPSADEVEAVADVIYPAIDGPHEAAVALSQAAIAALDAARGNAEPVAASRKWANALANIRQGRRSEPLCEPPSEYAIENALEWLKDALLASPTPLYAHPPAPDAARGDPVARVVEWLRAMKRDDTNWPQHIAFLIERGEPFNAD